MSNDNDIPEYKLRARIAQQATNLTYTEEPAVSAEACGASRAEVKAELDKLLKLLAEAYQQLGEAKLYNKTVDEQIKEFDAECGTHGKLDTADISVASDGSLHCKYCSLNQEMDTQNEMDIDSSINVSF